MQSNPYQAPKATVGGIDATEDTEKVRSGQKLLIYAILLNFVTMGLQAAGVPLLGLLVVLAALGMSLVGISAWPRGWDRHRAEDPAGDPDVRAARQPDHAADPQLARHKLLREAGYTVGLMGASR